MSEDEIIQYIEEHFDEVYKESMEDCDDEEIFVYQYIIKKFKKEMEQEKEKNKNLIKQLQEQNTEIQDISKQLRGKEQEDIKMRAKFILSLDDYITKDKIRSKIKELEEKSDYWNCDEIEVLKELLERR